MTRLSISVCLWVALLGFAAGAQDKATAAAPDTAKPVAQNAAANQGAASDSSAIRVRASHRVEVIAPGEHVDTVIDRMRSTTVAPANTGTQLPAERLQVRSPDLTRSSDRGQAEHQRGQQQHGGGPASGGPNGAGPGPSGNGPPQERR